MVVAGYYVPNTPTLLVGPDRPVPGLPTHAQTLQALAAIGEEIRSQSIELLVVVTPHMVAAGGFPILARSPLRQIYDFQGFPEDLYQVRYEPSGHPAFASALVREAHPLPVVAVDDQWGLDHGAWAPLSRMVPDASVPVVALGLALDRSDLEHQALGRAVAAASTPWRTAVVATGSLVHRLDLWDGRTKTLPALAQEVLHQVQAAWEKGSWEAIWTLPAAQLREAAPEGGLKPLRVLAGAVGTPFSAQVLCNEEEWGAASLTTARFAPASRS
jgi:4,5-DOPA dioxygenase extradiol